MSIGSPRCAFLLVQWLHAVAAGVKGPPPPNFVDRQTESTKSQIMKSTICQGSTHIWTAAVLCTTTVGCLIHVFFVRPCLRTAYPSQLDRFLFVFCSFQMHGTNAVFSLCWMPRDAISVRNSSPRRRAPHRSRTHWHADTRLGRHTTAQCNHIAPAG